MTLAFKLPVELGTRAGPVTKIREKSHVLGVPTSRYTVHKSLLNTVIKYYNTVMAKFNTVI